MSALLLAVAMTLPAAGRAAYVAGETLIVAVPMPQGGGLAPVPAATSLAAVADLVKAQVAGDDVGVKQMVEQGTAVLIPSGSAARVIKPYPSNPAVYEVRILGGPAKDRSAFVPEPWLVSPLQYRALAAEAKSIAKSREAGPQGPVQGRRPEEGRGQGRRQRPVARPAGRGQDQDGAGPGEGQEAAGGARSITRKPTRS